MTDFMVFSLAGLSQLVLKSTSTQTMSYGHYRFHGTLTATPIWEFFLLIQCSGITFSIDSSFGSAEIGMAKWPDPRVGSGLSFFTRMASGFSK